MAHTGAFVSTFRVPPKGPGVLDGLTFAVKDLIDVSGYVTGAGNLAWANTRSLATRDAPCVKQLLAAGATCVGKTVTDELAYSLLGENPTFGTPLNSRAPDRVPGGSSSGSASAVAAGEAAFALGTDTGGSVRVPAHNCGVWGYRPTHGVVSIEGVVPLAPTFDTVGVLANSARVLAAAGSVLNGQPHRATPGKTLYVPSELFELADAPIRERLAGMAPRIAARLAARAEPASLADFVGDATDLAEWASVYNTIQRCEAWSEHGAWISSTHPKFGPAAADGFALAKAADRAQLPQARKRLQQLRERLRDALDGNLLCLPTAPCLAPKKGERPPRGEAGGYYARTLALTALAGVGGVPQVSMPVADVDGVPVGLSLMAGAGQDALLLGLISAMADSPFSRF